MMGPTEMTRASSVAIRIKRAWAHAIPFVSWVTGRDSAHYALSTPANGRIKAYQFEVSSSDLAVSEDYAYALAENHVKRAIQLWGGGSAEAPADTVRSPATPSRECPCGIFRGDCEYHR